MSVVDDGTSTPHALSAEDARDLLDRQTEVLELIAAAAPLGTVLADILTSLERLMPGARCSVLLLERHTRTLRHGAAPSLPRPYIAAIDGLDVAPDAGSCGTAAALNQPVIAADIHTDPRWVRFLDAAYQAGLRSCWSTPIEGRDGLPIGTFAVYHDMPHRPSRREELLVERFTHLTSVAIEHASLVGDLIASEERFRTSFDDNALGMALVGLDGRIARTNTALAALTRARTTLTGQPLTDLLCAKDGTLTVRLTELHSDDAKPIVFSGLLNRSGSITDRRTDRAPAQVEVEVTLSLLRDADGTPSQYVVNVLDLTERLAAERDRRARLEAETARRTAESHSHAKSELLAAVGHEARTPMQAIVGFAELLGTIDLDGERRQQALDHISAAAGHVMDLLADVLDLSRIEAGALPLRIASVPVADVSREVLALLEPKAVQRQMVVDVEVGSDVVRADRRRLRQILLNLVSNSIRHGKEHGHVWIRSAHGELDRVVIHVEDDGPGIPPDFLPRAFEVYTRADQPQPSGDGHDEGIGLGLGLARGLADAMGGELTVARSGPAGTSMELRLPSA